jgi:uncharacterized protein (DUF433 family)
MRGFGRRTVRVSEGTSITTILRQYSEVENDALQQAIHFLQHWNL